MLSIIATDRAPDPNMMQPSRDIPLIVTSAAASSERRITPSWTIAQLKTKLESVTGIPPSAQKLVLRTANQPEKVIEAEDEGSAQIGQWPISDYAEIHVGRDFSIEAWRVP